MAEEEQQQEEKVEWRLGQQKTFGIEAIDRPNLREMQEYITGKDMLEFYETASKEEIRAVNKLASDIIYGGRGSRVSASQWDDLLSSKDYQTKMRKMGAQAMDLAGMSTREAKLRLKAMGLQSQVDLPEGALPMSFNQMQNTTQPKETKPSISDSEDGPADEAGTGGLLVSKAPLRKKRSLLGG